MDNHSTQKKPQNRNLTNLETNYHQQQNQKISSFKLNESIQIETKKKKERKTDPATYYKIKERKKKSNTKEIEKTLTSHHSHKP